MTLDPYKRPPAPPRIGLVRSDRTVLDEAGDITTLANADPRLVLFGDRDLVKGRFLVRSDGAAVCWNGVAIRWEADERRVILLGSYPGDGYDVLDGLVMVRDFLASRGAVLGSASASSWSLLRATLSEPVTVYSGKRKPTITEVIGGRQQSFVEPGHLGAFEAWDMTAAYASTLGHLVYGGQWRRWGQSPPAETDLPVMVRARVSVPPSVPFGPLPKRKLKPAPLDLRRWRLDEREYPHGPGRRIITGNYTAAEIRAAERAGAQVRYLQTWIQTVPDERQPFAPWFQEVERARRFPGFAGIFAKVMGNALVGRFFGSVGERTRVHYVDSHPISEPLPNPSAPRDTQAIDAAELVTGTVRARLLSELMLPAGDHLISVHTDGGLVFPIREAPFLPAAIDDWRCKDRGENLIYLDPGTYAYTRKHQGSADVTVYKVSGVRHERAKVWFEALADVVLHRPTIGARRRGMTEADGWAAFVEAFPEAAEVIRR